MAARCGVRLGRGARAALALMGLACGSSSSGSSTTDAGGSAGEEPTGTQCPAEGSATFECALPTPCTQVDVTNHTSGGDGEPIAFADTSAARCVLEALRDRTKGAFTIVGNTGGGQFLQRDTVYSLGDGTAVLVRSDTQDDSFREYGPTRMVLKDAAAFEECLADRSGRHRERGALDVPHAGLRRHVLRGDADLFEVAACRRWTGVPCA